MEFTTKFHHFCYRPFISGSEDDLPSKQQIEIEKYIDFGDTFNPHDAYQGCEVYVVEVNIMQIISFNLFVTIKKGEITIHKYDSLCDMYTLLESDVLRWKFLTDVNINWDLIEQELKRKILKK